MILCGCCDLVVILRVWVFGFGFGVDEVASCFTGVMWCLGDLLAIVALWFAGFGVCGGWVWGFVLSLWAGAWVWVVFVG